MRSGRDAYALFDSDPPFIKRSVHTECTTRLLFALVLLSARRLSDEARR